LDGYRRREEPARWGRADQALAIWLVVLATVCIVGQFTLFTASDDLTKLEVTGDVYCYDKGLMAPGDTCTYYSYGDTYQYQVGPLTRDQERERQRQSLSRSVRAGYLMIAGSVVALLATFPARLLYRRHHRRVLRWVRRLLSGVTIVR
jgi:hypothetical protein